MCELILQSQKNSPQYSKDFVDLFFFDKLRWALNGFQEQNKVFAFTTPEYISLHSNNSSQIRKSFCDKKLLAINFITIW